ncbi:MAG: hypothetical protein HY543_11545 [Deltaproteobacteria bacterium]|nr:hypothetical protein [Deltaproteobacteria bacterium]
MAVCAFCGAALADPRAVARRDVCSGCGKDLHCCLQCRFYDRQTHHECREPQAEYVAEKVEANFCEYFELMGTRRVGLAGEDPAQEKAKRALDALFKK